MDSRPTTRLLTALLITLAMIAGIVLVIPDDPTQIASQSTANQVHDGAAASPQARASME